MRSTVKDFFGGYRAPVWALLGLVGSCVAASAQATFDPYRPDSSRYNSYVYPTLPNNLALPGSARDAEAYDRLRDPGSGLSRSNTFERYLRGLETPGRSDDPSSARRRGPAIGIPYFEAERRTASAYRREDEAIVERDRAFFEEQARRDRLYRAAMRERDPVKRSQLLREIAKSAAATPEIVRPRSGRTQPTRPQPVQPIDPKPAPRAETPSRGEALAAEALKGVDASPPNLSPVDAPAPQPAPAPSRSPSAGVAVPDTATLLRRERERQKLKAAEPTPRPKLPSEKD